MLHTHPTRTITYQRQEPGSLQVTYRSELSILSHYNAKLYVERMESKDDFTKAALEKEISSVTKNIEEMFAEKNALKIHISRLEKDIEEGESLKDFWRTEGYSNEILEKYTIISAVIDINASQADNIRSLLEYIEKKRVFLQEQYGLYHQKEILIQGEKDRLERYLAQPGQDRTGIRIASTEVGETESGLEYVQASHRIGIASAISDDWKNIGLVEEVANEDKTYQVRTHVEEAPVYEDLEVAWSRLMQRNRRGNWRLKNDAFVARLAMLVPQLNGIFLSNAWQKVEFDVHASAQGMGEMALQQLIYNPFSVLFMAAAGGCDSALYKADQLISSSLSVLFKDTEASDSKASKVASKPDAAVTLEKGLDAYGVMEMKSSSLIENHPHFVDNCKCVLTTVLTAIALRKSIKKEQYRDVALPFIVASGTVCSLYVTTFDEQGIPCIRVVKYPQNDGNARNQDCSKSKTDQWRKLFVALAVLLNQVKRLYETTAKANYKKLVAESVLTVSKLPPISFGGKEVAEII